MTESTGTPPDNRDRQRTALYAAENQVARMLDRSAEFPVVEIAGSHVTLPVERHFAEIASVQSYVDKVLDLHWVRTQWPRTAARPVTVRKRRSASRSHYEFGTAVIALPLHRGNQAWALRELIVLHELAHHLGGDDVTHGPEFAGRLVELIDGIIGPEAAFLMRVAMADQGVQIS